MSNNRTPDDPNNKKNTEKSTVGRVLNGISQELNTADTAAKVAGQPLPQPFPALKDVVNMANDMVNNPTQTTMTDVVCGGLGNVAKSTASATLTTGLGVGVAVATPTLDPVTRTAAGLALGAAAQPLINEVTKPVGKATEKVCRVTADLGGKAANAVRGWFATPVTPKEQQNQQAQNQSANSRASYDNANRQAQRQVYQQVMSRAECFKTPFQYRQHSSIIPSNLVWRAEQNAIWEFRLRYGSVPTWVENQIRKQVSSSVMHLTSMSLNSSSYGIAEFSLTLMATSLINSYNSYHLGSSIYSPCGLCGDIGGVASEVSMISDLVDSEAHAAADSYYLCFPAKHLPFSEGLFNQVERELHKAFSQYGALPFFSLHFNQSGFLYPVLHPAYQNTLIGEIIGLLDYFLKCYLNGGIYDPSFLKMWHELANCDETFLRSKIIDLKKYCKEHLQNFGYLSLRELESRYGVKGQQSKSAYQQPFMTSFRIIAYQKKIERHDNILIPYPDFKVEYSIDLMPDYQQYVDSYVKENGQLPPEYKQIRECYESFCREVKEKMPKLPLCKDYFNLLGVINSLCYLYTTLDKMGKKPVFAEDTPLQATPFPKALPPIPVRYYHTYDFNITLQDILTPLTNTPEKIQAFNQQLAKVFSVQNALPDELIKQIEGIIKPLVTTYLGTQLPPQETAELNEEDIARITKQACHHIWGVVNYFSSVIENEINNLFEQSIIILGPNEQTTLIDMPFDTKIPAVRQHFQQQMAALKIAWQNVTTATKKDELTSLWARTKKLVSIAIPQYNILIEALKENKASELAKLTPQQRTTNAANIAKFERDIDQNITAVKAKIDRLQSLNHIFGDDDDLDILFASIMRKSQKFTNEHKTEILNAIQLGHDKTLAQLDAFSALIKNFAPKLLGIKQVKEQVISKKYTHSFLGFTGKALAEKTKDNYQIVGGCGMSLPNLTSEPIPHADVFCTAVVSAVTTAKNGKAQFEHNGTVYVVHALPVCDIDMDLTPPTQTQTTANTALEVLDNIAHEQVAVTALTPDQIKTQVNSDGYTVMHYAASTLKPEHFQHVLTTAPNALELRDQYGNLPIHSAARSGNTDAIIKMLDRKPTLLEAQNKRGITPPMIAIQFGQLPVVELLNTRKANFNHTLANGLFPLYMAIQKNFAPLALWMLNNVNNLDVNKELDSKMTALHLSIQSGSTELSQRLVARGARCDIRRKSDGFTALHCAVQQGDVALLRAMITAGASVNLALESKKTPLHLAAEADHLDVVQLLMERGALVDAQTIEGDTPLMLAIKAGQIEIALSLAEKAIINTVNQQQQSASQLALQYGMPAVGDVLMRRGEYPTSPDKSGANYLYYLVRNGEYQRVKQILSRRAALHQLINGNSLLAIAAQHGHFLLVNYFEEMGSTYKSTTQHTLLDYAVMADEIGYLRDHYQSKSEKTTAALALIAANNSSVHCLQLLLQHLPANACQNPDLLLAAIASNDEKTVTVMLKYCRDINKPLDAEGNTPLHIAVKQGANYVLPMLAERGCEFSKVNNHNQTAFHLAVIQEDADLLKRLFKLSKPNDWPLSLWSGEHRDAKPAIAKLLKKYEKRLPAMKSPNLAQEQSTAASTLLPPCPMLNQPQRELLKTFKRYIDQGQFDKINNMLSRHPILVSVFQSVKGAGLFQRIFKALEDVESLYADANRESKAAISRHVNQIDKLLSHLKRLGTNPAKFLGEKNVLIAMISADSDQEACYRLKIFMQHFPEALPVLTQDKVAKDISIMQLMLSRNQYALFERVDELCKQQNDHAKFSSLHEAIRANRYDLVERLLKRYAVNSVNHQGITPLMLAAAQGNLQIVNLLLRHGACVDSRDHKGQTVLHYALMQSSQTVALTLLPLLKRPNQSNRFGVTPFMLAAAKGLVPVLRFLCESGHEDVHTFDDQGQNAMHHAAIAGQVNSIRYLAVQGFSPDQPESPHTLKKIAKCLKRTPLHLATLLGREEAVLTMLDLSANPNQEDARGNALSEYAVLSKNKEMLDLAQLLPSYHNKERNRHLLHAAAMADQVDVLSELILDGANLNALNEADRSAMHLACIHNSGAMASLLLKGDDLVLNGIDRLGNAPLHYAAEFGHVRLIELLAKAGVNINQLNSNGDSALSLAAAKGHIGAVTTLLNHKADASKLNQKGMTSAQVALLHQQFPVAKALKDAGDNSLTITAFANVAEPEKKQLLLLLPQFENTFPKNSKKRTSTLMKFGLHRPKQGQKTVINQPPTHSK